MKSRSLPASIAAALALACAVFVLFDGDSTGDSRRALSVNQFSDPKSVRLRRDTEQRRLAGAGPNVIFIQHESFSGSLALQTGQGQQSMPFFQDLKINDDNMYVFEHTRTVSGSTVDAMPALMTGCHPYTAAGVNFAQEQGRAIGYEFRKSDYPTASFSSRPINKTIKTGQWKMLYDVIVGAMDRVFDPISQQWENKHDGNSDALMLPEFAQWVTDQNNADATAPFYAQFYNFNQHFSYLKNSPEGAYYSSLEQTDLFLKGIFDILADAGRLENTIIIGSGDHGEDPYDAEVRSSALTPNILHTASYIYYPEQLMPADQGIKERLRRNTQQLTSTLDFYPTIRSILDGGYDSLTNADEGCLTGVDLATYDIPEDRVTVSMNTVSSGITSGFLLEKPPRTWALSNKDRALYHRQGGDDLPDLQQSTDNFYVFNFGGCTQDDRSLCMDQLNHYQMKYFGDVIESLKISDWIGEDVKTSELINFFAEKVEWSSPPSGMPSISTSPSGYPSSTPSASPTITPTMSPVGVDYCVLVEEQSMFLPICAQHNPERQVCFGGAQCQDNSCWCGLGQTLCNGADPCEADNTILAAEEAARVAEVERIEQERLAELERIEQERLEEVAEAARMEALRIEQELLAAQEAVWQEEAAAAEAALEAQLAQEAADAEALEAQLAEDEARLDEEAAAAEAALDAQLAQEAADAEALEAQLAEDEAAADGAFEAQLAAELADADAALQAELADLSAFAE